MGFPKKVGASIAEKAEDMMRAYRAEAFHSAISMALALPDICGAALYPGEKSGARYAKWFDEYVAFNYPSQDQETATYFNGNDCYQLRCVYLHEGINAPHIERGRTVYNMIQFRLFNESAARCDHLGCLEQEDANETVAFQPLDLDLRKFIESIKTGVFRFIDEHPDLNSPSPLKEPESVFYCPILDFRN